MQRQLLSLEDEENCAAHPGKKIEVFCDDCKEILCIDCILTKVHKNHDMLSLEKGSEKERTNFVKICADSNLKRNELEH